MIFFGGKIQYGWKRGFLGLVPVPEEQSIIKRIVSLHKEKHSLRKISAILAEENLLSRQKKPFSAVQISRILSHNL